ncbi:MAG: FKBP-type peptidyl-prolyl cis-trans isomerase [Paramuribaculum sp.]|nr:FKBP-type peptidyl-prolyl cis-trans isomerase [Paramuribaculum sp.]
MKKLFFITAAIFGAGLVIQSCGDSDNQWNEYEDWRKANNAWYAEMEAKTNPDGSPYYSLVQPSWYPESRLLIHYFNDRSKTEGNLQPLITSQVTVKYKGYLYDGNGFDSTTVASDSVRTFLLAETIVGWQVALTQMHVGDSCEIIVPYTMGYGYMGNTSSTGVVTIPPYSALRFNIGLKDIPAYEIP